MKRIATLKRNDELPVLVSKGTVKFGAVFVERDYGDCLLVCVFLHSKHASSFPVVGDGPPTIYFTRNEETLDCDDSTDASTTITFVGFDGWSVFGSQGPSRYLMNITLIAPYDKNECE